MDDNPEMEVSEARPGIAPRTPPYVSFQTFLNLIEELKTNGLPPQIDRSVLRKFAGGVQSQLFLALRSLNLVHGKGDMPTDALAILVRTFGTDQFKDELRAVIEQTYPYVMALDLTTATPTMFADAFKDNTIAKEDVLRKCRTFFLYAAKYVEIPLGQRLTAGVAPRASNGGGARRKSKAARKEGVEAVRDDAVHRPEPTDNVITQLLGKFPDFDPTWPDEIKTKWFAGFDQFMKAAKPKG